MPLVGRTSKRREASLRHRRAAPQRGRWAAATLVIAIVGTTAAYVGVDSWKKWHAPVPASSDRVVAPAVAPPVAIGTAAAPSSKRMAQGKVKSAAPGPGGNTTQVTKCVVNGATTYSDANCPTNAQASTLTVNPADNLAAGLPADVRRQVLAGPAATVSGAPDAKSVCASLDEKLKALDALARPPLAAAEQDRLTAERQVMRDQQFRLGC